MHSRDWNPGPPACETSTFSFLGLLFNSEVTVIVVTGVCPVDFTNLVNNDTHYVILLTEIKTVETYPQCPGEDSSVLWG